MEQNQETAEFFARAKQAGAHWGSGPKRPPKFRRLDLGKEDYRLGTLGPDDDRLKAQLLWLSASPAAGFRRIRPRDGWIRVTTSAKQGQVMTFHVGMIVTGKAEWMVRHGFVQCVLAELVWAGKRVRFDQMTRSCADGRWYRTARPGQVREIRWNGPLEFDIDRPLEETYIDMVATFGKTT